MVSSMRSHIEILFGKSLRTLRLKRKLSQVRLGEFAGLRNIGRIERGQQNVGLINIGKLAHALKSKAAELLRKVW